MLFSSPLLSALVAGSGLLNGVLAAPSNALADCASKALTGDDVDLRIQLPSDDTWEDARVGAMINPETPALIAFVRTVDEIPGLLACAKQNGVRAVPRAGRHHFESWSALNGTLVVDVAHVDEISVSDDLKTATIGAGANLGQIYTILSQHGKTVVGGICPTVGIGGYMTTGGYSLQQRTLGMAVDQMVSFRIITAAGELLTVSPSEHPDLWWAARGGGQFGIIVDAVVKIESFPRSAMVSIQFPDASTRYDTTKIYHEWAPKQVPEFNSQFNLYSDRTEFLGWYLGGSKEELQSIMEESGFLDIPNAVVSIDGDCSTENSRMYWLDETKTCTDDDTAYTNFLETYNTKPINIVPIEPKFRLDNENALPSGPPAALWPRFDVISKTYFELKGNRLTDESIKEVVDRSGELDSSMGFWIEMTTFNISAPSTTGAFPWQDDAYTLQRLEVSGGSTPEENAANRAWITEFDKFYRPVIGEASYAGYIDASIGDTANPYTAYYGSNVCRLVEVKQQYDPDDFFKNPLSIPTTVPEGVSC